MYVSADNDGRSASNARTVGYRRAVTQAVAFEVTQENTDVSSRIGR